MKSSTFCARSTPWMAVRICDCGSWARCVENTTSSAVNAVPSWNFTPSRSLKRQVRSFTWFQDTASQGMTFQSLSRQTSGS